MCTRIFVLGTSQKPPNAMIEKHFDAIAIKVVEAIILGGPQHVSQIGDLPGIVNEMGSSLIWKFSKSS